MQSDFSTALEMTALAVDQASPFCHFDQRGEISERSDGQKVIDRVMQSDFSTALEMTELFLSTTHPRAKPWLLRERGAATERSCKPRLHGLLKAQFTATRQSR